MKMRQVALAITVTLGTILGVGAWVPAHAKKPEVKSKQQLTSLRALAPQPSSLNVMLENPKFSERLSIRGRQPASHISLGRFQLERESRSVPRIGVLSPSFRYSDISLKFQ